MSKIGIFYGTTTGVTEDAANKIADKLDGADVFNIAGNEDKLGDYDVLILGTSTWGFGDLQDDLKGKKVAYFGCGDQMTFSETYVDGIGILNEEIEKTGAEVIGQTSTEGYDFSESRAFKNSKFLGLAIDEINQPDLTDERIDVWVEELKKVL